MALLELLRGLLSPSPAEAAPALSGDVVAALAERLAETGRARLGRSLALFAAEAGACGACGQEVAALAASPWSVGRFGLEFVASPRHADVLLVSGTACRNLREALELTLAAMPAPRWVVAVGDCAAGAGPFAAPHAVEPGGVAGFLPVDLVIPGCPPSPRDILEGLLSLLRAQEPPVPPRIRRPRDA